MQSHSIKFLGTLLLVAAPAFAQRSPVTALRFGALVDATGRSTPDAVVVVQADTILAVGTGARAIPARARVVDLRRYTAIPGLIDVHTHMTYWRDKANPTGPVPRSKDSVVMMAAENARRTLETGVTTVRDLGASNYADIAMRDSINKGAMIGPRMFVAGYGLSKVTIAPSAGTPSTAPRGRVRDTSEIKEAIKAQVAAGADWIKMYGSTGSFQNVTGVQTFTDAEMRVATETAHRYGKPIAIHSYGESGGRAAILAGAESVEHPAGLDDATLAEWARRGTMYVPTIDHNRFYAENAALLGYSVAQVAALDSFRLFNLETARRAHRAGVKFAMGSDVVYWMHGENTRELAWFVKAGMTPAQALATATTNGAALLRMPTKLGKIAPGYYADIVAVDGNPLRDIDVILNRVVWVMKGGAVVVDKRTVGSLPAATQARTVMLLNYAATVPARWTARTPASSMRLAEFVVPGVGGKDSAEVVVYYFGAGQGGGIQANLARWKSQFSDPAGQPVFERVTRDSSGAMPLTIAEYRGTYARGIGAGAAPGAARPNHTLIAVVAETPRGTLFFQLFGPAKAVETARETYLGFVRGMR